MAYRTVFEAQPNPGADQTHPENPYFSPEELHRILGITIHFKTPGGRGVRVYKVELTDSGDGKPVAVVHAYN